MNRTQKALACFADGYNCAQSVLSAFADELRVDEGVAFRISAGFGGGMGRMGETCGAVTGAVMVLELRHGVAEADQDAKERVYHQIAEFIRQFKARHGTCTCRELLGCDLSTPEGLQRARDEGLFTTACPRFVHDAVKILEEMENNW